MSGAERLAILSIAANVIAVANFSAKVLNVAKGFGDDVRELPGSLGAAATVVPLISITFAQTQRQIESGDFSEAACSALVPLYRQAKERLGQLEAIFKNAVPEIDESKPERVWKAIKTIRKEKHIKEIVEALDRIAAHSTHFRVSVAPTSATLSDLERCVASLSLPRHQATEGAEVSIHDYSHVPLSPTKSFIDRPALSSKLTDSLSSDSENDAAEPIVVVVHGLGGAGKSQLVLNHIKNHRKDYAATFWIEAGNVQSIERDFHQIYRILYNLPGVPSDKLPNLDEVITLVKNWFLRRDGKWLIVFDEMDSVFEEENNRTNRFHTWLPATRNVHVVLTTRDSRAADLTKLEAIEVDGMNREEACALFKTCAGFMTNQQDHHVFQIVEELGFFALAVSLAGYYVKQTPWLSSDLARYLPQYRQKRKDILSEKPRQAVHYYSESVLTTWETSFSAVQARSPTAANLFLLVCWLNPKYIFDELLIAVLKPTDEWDCGEADPHFTSIKWLTEETIDMHGISSSFRCLQDYSLVRWEPTQCSYRIHTLVRAWAQDRLDPKNQERFIMLAVKLLSSAIYLERSNCRLQERLVSHLDQMCHTIYERFHRREIVDINPLRCLKSLDGVFIDIGRDALLKTVRHFEAEISSSLYGELDPRSLKAKSNLAGSFLDCGYLRPARDLYKETLKLQSQVLGEDHEDWMRSLKGLADVFFFSENLKMAIKVQARVVKGWQSRRIESSYEVFQAQRCLATYLCMNGDLDEATAILEVLIARRQVLDVSELALLDAMEERAHIYNQAGYFEMAHSMSMQVLARRQTLLGDLSSETFSAMSLAATTLGKMGRKAEEEKMLLAVLERAKQACGPTRPETLFQLAKLAWCLDSRGDYRRALTLRTEIIVYSYHFRDELQYHYFDVQDILANALQRRGDYCYAVKALYEAYCRLSTFRDTDYTVLLNILGDQVDQLEARRDRLAAIALARESQGLMKREWGEGHTGTLFASKRLVTLLLRTNQRAEAQQIQERMLETLSESRGHFHPRTIREKATLALILGEQGKLEEAESLLRGLVSTCIAHRPKRWISLMMHYLALVLVARDVVEEGLSLHLRAAAIKGAEAWIDESGSQLSCQRLVRDLIQDDYFEPAEEYIDKMNAQCEQVLGPHDTRTINVRRWLADILASRQNSSASSEISSELSCGPKRIITYSSTGRQMKISRWRLRPSIRKKVIFRLPRSQRRQWEEVSTGSWEAAVIGS